MDAGVGSLVGQADQAGRGRAGPAGVAFGRQVVSKNPWNGDEGRVNSATVKQTSAGERWTAALSAVASSSPGPWSSLPTMSRLDRT